MGDTDDPVLASLDTRLSYIRDYIRGVATGFHTGCLIYGGGGTGKSHTVRTTLEEAGRAYVLTNTRVTGRGLFSLLRDHPDAVHVIEDAESFYAEKSAPGLLRSATHGSGENGRHNRVVTWGTVDRERFLFTGGLVIVSNSPLPKLPEWSALKTRIKTLEFQPTTAEVAAKMKALAKLGHRHNEFSLSPSDCLEVATEIISRSHQLQHPLDLRLFVNTCQDRLQYQAGLAENHWLDLLDAAMQERVVGRKKPESRVEKASRELRIVRELMRLPTSEQLPAWQRATNKSPATFYRVKSRLMAEKSQSLKLDRRGSDESRALGA